MSKAVKRLSLAVLSALLLVCLVLVGACNKDRKTVKLTFMDGETEYASVEANAGDDIAEKLPEDPTKEGYLFGGWYSSADGTGEKQELPTTMPERDATYYAKWSEAPKATLTLVPGAGTLEKTTYEVYVGTDLKAYLKDIEPTVSVEGVAFGGWYQGDKLIASGDTMSEEGLTLTARYTTSYTVKLYKETVEAEYPETPETLAAQTGFYGEALDPEFELPAHFKVDYSLGNPETDSLAANAVFEIYLRRERVGAVFSADAPEGVAYSGSIDLVNVPYGGTLTLPDGSGFGLPATYRFGGWATEEGGAVAYAAGDSYTAEGDVTFHAQWEKGMLDVFGGDDLLFLSISSKGTITLSRAGLGEKQGTYDAATRAFTIQAEKETLQGKFLAGEDYFYYYRDLFETEHPSFNGDGTTLEFRKNGAAVYTDAEGTKYTGSYEVLDDRSSYRFVSEELTFLFDLENGATGFVFHRQGTENGAYALDGTKMPVLVLDGMGHVELHYDEESAELFYRDQTPVLEIYGWYFLDDPETKTYVAENFYDAEGRPAGIWFSFRLGDGAASEVSDFEITGSWQRDDGLANPEGRQYQTFDYSQSLTLDGFGHGVYATHEGTYTVETDSWLEYQITMTGAAVYMHEVQYVVFTYEETTVKLLPVVYGDVSYTYYQFLVLDEDLGEHGMIPFGNALVMDNGDSVESYESGFLYYYGGGMNYQNAAYSLEIWIYYGEALDGDVSRPVYLKLQDGNYEKFFSGSYYSAPSDLEEGEHEYHYLEYNTYAGGFPFDYTFRFKIVEGEVRFSYEEQTVDEARGLTLDRYGYAKQNGTAVDYTADFENSYAPVYTFTLAEGTYRYVKLGDTFYDFTEPKYYVYEYVDGGRQNVYQARMWLTPDKGKAILEFLIRPDAASYDYVSVFVAEVTPVEGKTGEYNFRRTNGAVLDAVMADEYNVFRFKLTEEGFVQYDKELTLENLTTDGYGNAVYTPENGEPIHGTYCYKESLVVFTAGETVYRLVAGEKRAEVTTEEADRYYFVDADGNIDILSYIYLDGKGGFILVRSGLETGKGTYVELGPNTVLEDDPMEYEATFEGGAKFSFIVYEEQGVHIYFEKDLSQTGEFDIFDEDGTKIGHISGNGYTLGVYTDYSAGGEETYSAAMIVCNVVDGNTYARDFTPNKDGAQVAIGLIGGNEIIGEIACDINEARTGAVVRGMPYGGYADSLGSDYTLYLDGHGRAVYGADSGRETVAEGTYSFSTTHNGYDLYLFEEDSEEEDKVRFLFALSFDEGLMAGTTSLPAYYFHIYTAEEDGVYLADDGAVLITNGYRDAVYIDKYGLVEQGMGTYRFGGWFIEFSGDYSHYWIEVLGEGKFRIVTEDYIARDGTLYLYTGSAASFQVPEGITEIGDEAFSRSSSLNEIDLGSVTKIGKSAFENRALKVVRSESVLEVGDRAFYNCARLTTVDLPAAVKIGKEAFMMPQSNVLASVRLKAVEFIGAYAFANTQNADGKEIFIDLSEADLTKLQIDETAFCRVQFGTPDPAMAAYVRFIVKDVATVNSLAAGSLLPETVRGLAVLSSEAPAYSYIDLANGVHYAFSGGSILSIGGASSMGYVYADSLGIYALNDETALLYPVKAEGGYETTPVTLDSSAAVGESVLFRTGTSITLQNDGQTLQFTISFENGYTGNANAIVDTVSAATLGGKAIALTYSASEKAFFGVDEEGNRTKYTVVSETAFASSEAGKELTFEKENEVRITLVLDENGVLKEVKSAEEYFGGEYRAQDIFAFKQSEGKVTVALGSQWSPSGAYVIDTKENTITKVMWESNTYYGNPMMQIVYTYEMIEGVRTVTDILTVKNSAGTSFTNLSCTQTETNNFTVSFTDFDGKARTFTMVFSGYGFTVTETTV